MFLQQILTRLDSSAGRAQAHVVHAKIPIFQLAQSANVQNAQEPIYSQPTQQPVFSSFGCSQAIAILDVEPAAERGIGGGFI